MRYKCLKKGWLPYQEAFNLYIQEGDMRRFINKVPETYKEKIGRIWFVNTIWFKSYKDNNR